MGSPAIRGHQCQCKFLRNGLLVKVLTFTKFTAKQDSTFSRSKYVGAAVPEGDQSEEGWSGSADAEVKNAEIDIFADALVTQNLAGVGVDEVTFVDTENYADGTSRSYCYFDIQAKISKEAGGLETKTTKHIEWQSSGRIPL